MRGKWEADENEIFVGMSSLEWSKYKSGWHRKEDEEEEQEEKVEIDEIEEEED